MYNLNFFMAPFDGNKKTKFKEILKEKGNSNQNITPRKV